LPCLKLQIRYIDPWELINFEKSDCKTFFSVIIVSFAWSVAKPPNNRWELNHFSFIHIWMKKITTLCFHPFFTFERKEMTYIQCFFKEKNKFTFRPFYFFTLVTESFHFSLFNFWFFGLLKLIIWDLSI